MKFPFLSMLTVHLAACQGAVLSSKSEKGTTSTGAQPGGGTSDHSPSNLPGGTGTTSTDTTTSTPTTNGTGTSPATTNTTTTFPGGTSAVQSVTFTEPVTQFAYSGAGGNYKFNPSAQVKLLKVNGATYSTNRNGQINYFLTDLNGTTCQFQIPFPSTSTIDVAARCSNLTAALSTLNYKVNPEERGQWGMIGVQIRLNNGFDDNCVGNPTCMRLE